MFIVRESRFSRRIIQEGAHLQVLISFAQWQYHNQWGSPEVWLLLVENFNQYPAMMKWNILRRRQFLIAPTGARIITKNEWSLLNNIWNNPGVIDRHFDSYETANYSSAFILKIIAINKSLQYGINEKKSLRQLHPVFPSGHPSKY